MCVLCVRENAYWRGKCNYQFTGRIKRKTTDRANWIWNLSLVFWMEECNFFVQSPTLGFGFSVSFSYSLSVSVSGWNFPAVWKSWPIVTAQPGVSWSIPLASHATQTHTHKHPYIHTQLHALLPALKGQWCLVGSWFVGGVTYSGCSRMNTLHRWSDFKERLIIPCV